MNLASWILFGVIVGLVTNTVDSSRKHQVIGWVGVSVLGAVIGGILGSIILGINPAGGSFNKEAFMSAVILSAAILISIEVALPKDDFNIRINKGGFRKI